MSDQYSSGESLFDLASFEDVHATDVELKNPLTGVPLSGAVISLAGPEHPVRKGAVLKRARELRRRVEAQGLAELLDEEDDAQEAELLADFTLGWRGLAMGGSALPFSREAAVKLYRDPARRWLVEQVQEALRRRDLFIRSCAAV